VSIVSSHQGLEALMARPLSQADLDRATEDMAAPLDLPRGGRRSALLFECAGERFAVLAVDVAKVVPETPVHRVPHRPSPVFRGISNTDGELLLCMSLEQALGLRVEAGGEPAPGTPRDAPEAEAPSASRVLVVIGGARDRWAFAVDRVLGVADIHEEDLRPAPVTVGAARNGCVVALVAACDQTASLLDRSRLAAIFRGAVA
jgi:chemotaxis signal transduction protein